MLDRPAVPGLAVGCRSLEELAESARTLNGDLTVRPGGSGGTTVRVVLPPYGQPR